MSKTMNMRHIRWKLMSTASALALSAAVYGAGEARAADADHPMVWIQLGGQFEKVRGLGDIYDPPFTSELLADGFSSPLTPQRALSWSVGEEGAISFQPENSDWIFSAAIRYGRASGGTVKHEQTPGGPRKVVLGTHSGYLTPAHHTAKFSETLVDNSELHTILDFQAGKDVGVGLFGSGSKSTVSFGVRFAQLSSKQHAAINADPDFHFPSNLVKYPKYHHTYQVSSHVERNFRGIGPSVSWNSSVPLAGNPEDSEITLDWGVNAAALFGRQRASGHHQTLGSFYRYRAFKYSSNIPIHRSGNLDRSRSVVVPNLGGFAGVSFVYSDAKISLGYRGDFFFGAIDSGIDTRHSTARGFYGPFASVSIGVGD